MGARGTMIFSTIIVLLVVTSHHTSHAGTYDEASSLVDDLLEKSNYKPQIRPLLNQSEVLEVYVFFELMSIMEVNDVLQSFSCNGFMGFFWVDQRLRWHAKDYGGVTQITPQSTSIFRPTIALINTMDVRDIFRDDTAPVVVQSSGYVTWIPGSIFSVSCKLDLTNYPFDEQTCTISLIAMDFTPHMLEFVSTIDKPGRSYYSKSGEWEIKDSSMHAGSTWEPAPVSNIWVTFTLKRKPEFLVLSVLLPIVFLSLLNILVFVIPVESGEKISFGITVLLALSVFMSIISGMLPRSSESMPLMIRYIFSLLIISVLTVVDSIIIVRLHHLEEKEEQQHAPTEERKQLSTFEPKIMKGNHAQTLTPTDILHGKLDGEYFSEPGSKTIPSENRKEVKGKVKVNKYKLVGKHIDLVSLVLFGVVWVGVTVEFLVSSGARF